MYRRSREFFPHAAAAVRALRYWVAYLMHGGEFVVADFALVVVSWHAVILDKNGKTIVSTSKQGMLERLESGQQDNRKQEQNRNFVHPAEKNMAVGIAVVLQIVQPFSAEHVIAYQQS